MEDTIIQLKSISKRYTIDTQIINALAEIDFSVKKSDFTAITGPSGSGKTTLLNILSLIDIPSQGQIIFDGIETGKFNDNELSKIRSSKIGIVFQQYSLIPVLNVLENVIFPLQIKRISKHNRKEMAVSLLSKFGLENYLKAKPYQLSSGQRQRVAIARALVTEPLIIIADEPTAALDSKSGEETINLMKEINHLLNTTFVFSTHDMRIMKYAKDIIELVDGKITK
ncbi:MAG: ABC transporter ATP-binding protein [Bacteroidales bacterium]|jgi:putative ABC transport system ATP-binding protein|nr:ABC transporter ATP-binding protein [Bacteroidales bacterium]